MKKLIVLVAALLLAGCSKTSQNVSGSDAKPASAQAQPTGGQVRQASANADDADIMELMAGKKWKRIDKVDQMDGSKQEVEFAYFSQPVGDTTKADPPLFMLACAPKEIVIAAKTGAAESGKVRLKFGDSIETQDWLKGRDTLFARQPGPLLKQIMAAETFKFEYTPPEQRARVYEIRTLNLKEMMDSEPLCRK